MLTMTERARCRPRLRGSRRSGVSCITARFLCPERVNPGCGGQAGLRHYGADVGIAMLAGGKLPVRDGWMAAEEMRSRGGRVGEG